MVKQYYVAVGTAEAKLPTLSELILFLANSCPRRPFGTAVLCSSRDELDAVIRELTVPSLQLYAQHADLDLSQRLRLNSSMNQALTSPPPAAPQQREKFNSEVTEMRTGGAHADRLPPINTQRTIEPPAEPVIGHVMIATDACFRTSDTTPAFPHVNILISYSLAVRKDTFMRRLSLLKSWHGSTGRKQQSASRVIVHFAEAGLISRFREVEQMSASLALGPISVMPVQIADLFET